MTKSPLRLLISMAALAALSACVPNPKLEEPLRAPPVTGPFDLYFPNAEEIFKGPPAEGTVNVDGSEKQEAKTILPEMGEVKIGLLVPLTGDNAELGKDFQDAAILALYDAKLAFPGGYRITVIPKDTAGSPSVAVDMAKTLVHNDIKILVGPFYSQSTKAVASAVTPSIMLSLSNNTEVAAPNSFVFGITPEAEMTRAITYALKSGKKSVAAILPNDGYGRKLEVVIRNSLAAFGASLDAIEFYVPSKDGRMSAAKRLAGRIHQSSIDVICFGDSRENTLDILEQLQLNDEQNAKILKIGTSQWHTEMEENPALLQNGVYAASDQRGFNRFQKRFKSSYGRQPKRLSMLVYDAVMLLAEIASRGTIPAQQDLMAAETIQGPATGTYMFEPSGTVLRSLSLYEVAPSGYKVLEHAPKQF